MTIARSDDENYRHRRIAHSCKPAFLESKNQEEFIYGSSCCSNENACPACAGVFLFVERSSTRCPESAWYRTSDVYPVCGKTAQPEECYRSGGNSAGNLEWTFTSGATTYTYNMVGTTPSTGSSTTVQVEIIPIKIVIAGKGRTGSATFDPAKTLSNGNSVTANTVQSPIFSGIPFVSGGVNMGTTQYIDAYQRANFWGTVQSHTGYHVLLGGPTVLAEQTLSPPSRSGKTGTVFGFTAGLVDINWFDAQLHTLITNLGITPLPS